MGEVIEARELPVGRQVAMKVIHEHSQNIAEVRARFIEEAQITGQLEHPSIVPMHDLSIDDRGHVFYTMKRIEGRNLADILTALQGGESNTLRQFSLTRLLTIFQKICDAVAFAHSRGVIHRDLKPENVMVGGFGEVLVMDWGIAKLITLPERDGTRRQSMPQDESATHRTLDGMIMGTIGYMAPEQAGGDIEALGFRTDIYALGAILYEILTLHRTVSASSLEESLDKICSGNVIPPTALTAESGRAIEIPHCPGRRIPGSLAAVAMKALSLAPEDRYQTVEELQTEIEAYQNGFATGAEEAGFWRHFGLFVGRHKIESIAALIVLMAIVGGAVLAESQRRLAVHNRDVAEQAESRATEALAETALLLAESFGEKGFEAIQERSDGSLGLLWHTEALRLAAGPGGISAEEELPYRQRIAIALENSPRLISQHRFDGRNRMDMTWLDLQKHRIFQGVPYSRIEVRDAVSGALQTTLSRNPDNGIAVDGPNRTFAFEHRGKVSAYSFDDLEAPLWETVVEDDSQMPVLPPVYTFDNRYLIVMNFCLEAFVLEAETGRLIHRIDLGDGSRKESPLLNVSKFSYHLATYSTSRTAPREDRWLCIADAVTGEISLKTLDDPKGFDICDSGAFSPDGRVFVLGENYTSLRLFDCKTGEGLPSQLKFTSGNNPRQVVFSHPGLRVYSRNQGNLNAWQWPAQSPLWHRSPSFGTFALDPVRQDRLLVSRGRQVLLLDSESGESRSIFPGIRNVYSHAFAGGNAVAATIQESNESDNSDSSRITLWSLPPDYGARYQWLSGRDVQLRNQRTRSMTYDSSGNRALILADRGATLWDLPAGKIAQRFKDKKSGRAIDWSVLFPDGKRMAAVDNVPGQASKVFLADVASGKVQSEHPLEAGTVGRMDVSPDGAWLAVKICRTEDQPGSSGGREIGTAYQFWRCPDGEPVHTIDARTTGQFHDSVAFTPDSRFALFRSHRGEAYGAEKSGVTLLDLNTGQARFVSSETDSNRSLDWNTFASFDGLDRIAFADERTFVVRRSVWRIDPGSESGLLHLGNFLMAGDGGELIAGPLPGQVLLSRRDNHEIRLWDTETLQPISPPIRAESSVRALALHPNGRTLAAAGLSGRIDLWDLPTGLSLGSPLSIPDPLGIVRLSFVSGGRRLLSIDGHGGTVLCNVPEPVNQPVSRLIDAARLLSHRRLNDHGNAVPLDEAEWQSLWEQNASPDLTRAPLPKADDPTWISLFHRESFDGWKADSEVAFSFQGGLLKASNPSGPDRGIRFMGRPGIDAEFRNFELRTMVWCREDAHALLWFHTESEAGSKPKRGHIIHLRAAGSGAQMGAIAYCHDVVAPLHARANRWHELRLTVKGNRVTTHVDDRQVAFWEEPDDWQGREDLLPDRKLSSGNLYLSIRNGTVYFKDMAVRTIDE